MPVVMECEKIEYVGVRSTALPYCSECQHPFYFGQFALSLYERWRGLNYLVHAACEVPLIERLESDELLFKTQGDQHV